MQFLIRRSFERGLIERDNRPTAISSRRFDKKLVFGVIRGTQTARMLSYNIDSPETRSQVRLPTIVGRIESEKGRGRVRKIKRKRQREGERERGNEMEKETSQNCLLGLRIAVLPDEEVGKASRFPQRKNNALNRSSLVERMSNFAIRLPSNRLF